MDVVWLHCEGEGTALAAWLSLLAPDLQPLASNPLSPDKTPQGIRPICDARQYFIHMCSGILHPSLYSCAHTSATSSPFKAWALQHEIDVQSHLSSCVLQLEELKVVFQISKVFRCQIFIAVQHMASWLLFFFSFRLHSQITGSWSYFKFFSLLLHILVPSVRLCILSTGTYCWTWLEDGILYWQINIPALSALWLTELPKNTGSAESSWGQPGTLPSGLDVVEHHFMQLLFSLWPVLFMEILEANVPKCSESRTKWIYLQNIMHITIRKKE